MNSVVHHCRGWDFCNELPCSVVWLVVAMYICVELSFASHDEQTQDEKKKRKKTNYKAIKEKSLFSDWEKHHSPLY